MEDYKVLGYSLENGGKYAYYIDFLGESFDITGFFVQIKSF